MSRFVESDANETTQPLVATAARIFAVRLKSANKFIFRSLLSLASANLLIRVAGMVNQVVVTYRFGQGSAMDAYFVAATVPTLLAQMLASALESSVIPIYSKVRATRSKKKASTLFSTLLNILMVGLVLTTGIMLLFRNQIVFFSAIGLDPRSKLFAVDLTPFIFPVLLFMVINSFLECLLNSDGQFGWPAYAGMLVPLTTAALVLIDGGQGVLMLCIGTLLGQVLQLVVIIFRARRLGISYRPVIDFRNAELAAILIVAWPALLSALISQASPLIDQIFASFLPTGSISTLNYANKLISVFIGVIIASSGRAMLPYLSRQLALKDTEAFKDTLRLYLWAMGIATLVLTALMIVLAYPLVRILFQRGAFNAQDTRNTSITLIGFVFGLSPMALAFIISKAFSALGKTRLLMYVTIFSVFANALFDYVLFHVWQSFGIALATSIMYVCTFTILLFMLRREVGSLDLFTPPREILNFAQRWGIVRRYEQWQMWRENRARGISFRTRRLLLRFGIIVAVFAAGIVGVLVDASYTLRVAFGSLVVLALLRYRYALLITWVLLDAFIGSTLPFFNGNNLLTGLTAPTLLLLFYLPINQAFKRMPAIAMLFLFLLWVFAGIGISAIGLGPFLTTWTTEMDFVGVVVLAIFVVTTRKRLLLLIDAILLPSVFIALYGIYGYFTKQHGIPDAAIPSLFRISSIFGDAPPTLALFLSIIIPLALYRVTTLSGIRSVTGALVVLILLAALGLTFTRGAFISVPCGTLVMILLLPSRRMKAAMLGGIVALASLAVIVIVIGNIPIFSRFFNSDLLTLNGRTYLWQAILSHFDVTKVLGNGLKSSDLLLANLHVGNGIGVIGTATHNIYLEALYDHGLIGAALLILAFITLVVSLLRKVRGATEDYRMLLATCLAVFINVFIQSFEANDIWNQGVGIYFWLVMALPFALCWVTPAKVSRVEGDAPEIVTGREEEADDTAKRASVSLRV